MRVKPWLVLVFIGILAVGVLLLPACSGGSSSAVDQEPSATDTTASADDTAPVVNDQEPASEQVDETPVEESEPEPADDVEPVEETSETASNDMPPLEEIADQPLLTWGRDAGGLNHCDHMSIFSDGRVEAVVCRTGSSQPAVYGTLSEEQLSQVAAWVAEYSAFTRREMEMSRAVRTTTLNGTGPITPELEVKKEIAAFAAELYFGLTETE